MNKFYGFVHHLNERSAGIDSNKYRFHRTRAKNEANLPQNRQVSNRPTFGPKLELAQIYFSPRISAEKDEKMKVKISVKLDVWICGWFEK